MTDFFYLIPVALGLGAIGLAAFLWSLSNGQYDDLAGAGERILFDDHDRPITDVGANHATCQFEKACDKFAVAYRSDLGHSPSHATATSSRRVCLPALRSGIQARPRARGG